MRQEKFKKIVLPLTNKLFRIAFNITGNKEDAEDAVQDTLFNLWRKKDKWDTIENLEAYCFRSVRNISLDKLALKANQTQPIPLGFDHPTGEDDIQSQIEKKEEMAELEELLHRLPEKQRTIFLLREIENLSYKEIALVMDITEEQVKVGLFRTRQKLRMYFEELRNG